MYGKRHETGPRRPYSVAPTADRVLVRDIVASLRAHPGRSISDYSRREAIVAAVRDALRDGEPGR